MGIPFKRRGRTVDGVDCFGLIKIIYEEMGWKWEEPPVVYALDGSGYSATEYSRLWERIYFPERFCMVLMMWNNCKFPDHVGLVWNSQTVIHATAKIGVSLAKFSNIRDKIVGYYRYIGGEKW